MPPSSGRGVYQAGANANKPIAAADVKAGTAQILAWPMDPATKTVRSGTRLNTILVVAVDSSKMSAETKANAAGGVVAYSAVCTHQGCIVEGWEKGPQNLLCPCHQSEYDPRNGAKVLAGPAPNRLAALPLKVGGDGALTVAGGFQGHVGMSAAS